MKYFAPPAVTVLTFFLLWAFTHDAVVSDFRELVLGVILAFASVGAGVLTREALERGDKHDPLD